MLRQEEELLLRMKFTFAAIFLTTLLAPSVLGHGRLVVPAGRSSGWRYGLKTPVYYNDNELFCGGYWYQWAVNDGRCGICGDPYDQLREHEAGGQYASGTIVAEYEEEAVMDVIVDITANHLGYFEFRLCPHNDVTTPATQECFDEYLLPLADGSGTRLPIYADMYLTKLQLQLPAGVTCSQCILQWKYNTGNSWGVDEVTGEMGLGYGPQEQFYGCSDISIVAKDQSASTTPGPKTTTKITTKQPPSTQPSTTLLPTTSKILSTITKTTPPTKLPTTTASKTKLPSTTTSEPNSTTKLSTAVPSTMQPSTIQPSTVVPSTMQPSTIKPSTTNIPTKCRGVGDYKSVEGMAMWCDVNCMRGYCPNSHCTC